MGCGSSQTVTPRDYTYYTATGSDYANYNYCNDYYQSDSRDLEEEEDSADITDWRAYERQQAYYNDPTINPPEVSDYEGFSDYNQWRKQRGEEQHTHKYQDFSEDNQKHFADLMTRFNEKQRRYEEDMGERRKKHLTKIKGMGKKTQVASKKEPKRDTEDSSTKLQNAVAEDKPIIIEETSAGNDSIPEPELRDYPLPSRSMLKEISVNVPLDEPDGTAEEEGDAKGLEDIVSLVLRIKSLKSPAQKQGQLSVRVTDTRQRKKPDFVSPKPKFKGKYVDTKFSKEVALGDRFGKEYEWKRPKEIYPDIKISLFHKGSSIDDVDQGVFGSCYILSVLAGLAESPSLMKQILPPDAYDVKAGLFHCRLWKYGCWYDIYIDDMLPCANLGDGTYDLVGCKSGEYKGEMWIALIEKAFAKFLGSYPAMEGGRPRFAYSCLTGGFAEWLAFKYYADKILPGPTYLRISNALQYGSVVTCSTGTGTVQGAVDRKECEEKGLICNHAYTVSATAMIKLTDTHEKVKLVKLRNPWAHKEWTGPWSDTSLEWDRTSEKVKMSLRVLEDEGEFWMEWSEFWRLFEDLNVCSTSPDFDHDGITDGLEEVSVIYGQWSSPDTTGGWKDLEKNPHFQFTVSSASEDPVYMVMELNHPKQFASDWSEIQSSQNANVIIKDEQGNHLGDHHKCYSTPPLHFFITLKPGATYALTPTKFQEGTDGEFMIRLFTSDPISVRPHNSSVPKRG